jgi:hypothetical protein
MWGLKALPILAHGAAATDPDDIRARTSLLVGDTRLASLEVWHGFFPRSLLLN